MSRSVFSLALAGLAVITQLTSAKIDFECPEADGLFAHEQTNLFCLLRKEKKQTKQICSFIRFLGESTARQSAFGFIWPLECQAIIHKTHLSNRKLPTSKHLKRGIFLLLTNKVSTVNGVCQNC